MAHLAREKIPQKAAQKSMGGSRTRMHRCVNNTGDKGTSLPLFGNRLDTLDLTMTCGYLQRVAGVVILSINGALASSPLFILRMKKTTCTGA